VAVVLPDTLIGHMLRVIFKPACSTYVPLPCKFFVAREAALEWLEEALVAPQPNSTQ
jgi:hypothetical protein